MENLNQWLASHHSDGVGLNIKELLYYQNKTALLDLSPRRSVQAKLAGSYLARTKGRGMEFDEARHYQPGDDIRAIDWRVTARTGKTHTKLFREEKERPVFILVDLSASMHFGTQLLFKSVQAAHLAALIAWSAQARGDRIGGLVFNSAQHKEFKPLTRHKAVLYLLHGIIELHQPVSADTNPQANFTDACARLRRLARPGSMVFLLSDFQHFDDSAQQHINRISRHCEVIACPISDPFEHQLPSVTVPQQVAITDGKAQQQILLGEQGIAQQYAERHAQQFAAIDRRLQQSHAQVMPVSAAVSLEQQLQPRKLTG